MKEGWAVKSIDEICTISGGGTPSKLVAEYWRGDIPWVSPKDMKSEVIVDSIDHISPKAIQESATSLVQPGAVLIVVRSGILARTIPLAIAGAQVAINQDIKALSPYTLVDSRFMFLQLLARTPDLLAFVSRGATVHRLGTEFIRELKVVLPPLPEQQRIVAILDESFAAIATAKANAEKNLQNARAVFERHLDYTFSNPPSTWELTRLGDVAETQYGLSEAMNEKGEGYKIFRMGEVQNGRLIDTGSMKYAPISAAEFAKYRLMRGDVLFNRTNSFEWVGKTGIFDLVGDYCFASYLVRVQYDKTRLTPEFLNYQMNSGRFQSSVKRKASRSINQANINATILSNEYIVVPNSLKEQQRLAAGFDTLRVETLRLESLYRRKLAALDELKNSLLHRAFNGDL